MPNPVLKNETQRTDSPAGLSAGWLLRSAGILGAIGVILGAFGAHGLEDWLLDCGLAEDVVARRVDQANTAVRYHLVHAVVLLGLFAASPKLKPRWMHVSGGFILAGILLFSGSLYVLVALNLPVMGAITPLGGLSWIIGWILLAAAAAKPKASP